MTTRFKLTLAVISFAVALISGCKENTLINANVAPVNNSVGVLDTTLTCITHTFYTDSILTNTKIIAGIGSVEDPFFGTTTGAAYFQVISNTPSPTIFDNNIPDSAELILPYTGFTYGDSANTSLTQTLQVFYVTDTLGFSTQYFAFDSKPIDVANPLSDPTTINLYHIKDSVSVLGVNYPPGARIKLKLPALLSRLLPAVAALSGTTGDFSAFFNTFKGICVKTADTRVNDGALPYYFLQSSSSQARIAVYYHPNGNPASPQVAYFGYSSAQCANINNISKSYSHYPVNDLIHSTQANDSVIALQNLPGTNIDIVIPGIKNLPKGIINKADIELTLLPGSRNPGIFAPPLMLNINGVGNGTYPAGISFNAPYIVSDRYPLASLSPYAILDGRLHTITSGGTTVNKYIIGIPRELMSSIAANNDTLHFRISGLNDFLGVYHLVAGGGSHPDPLYRAKLKIVYSTLNP